MQYEEVFIADDPLLDRTFKMTASPFQMIAGLFQFRFGGVFVPLSL